MSEWDKELDRCGVVTVEEAHEIASRFNASHWHNSRPIPDKEVARYSIPANPLRDDDIRLRAFIRNAARTAARVAVLEAQIAKVREALEWYADGHRHESDCNALGVDDGSLAADALGAIEAEP